MKIGPDKTGPGTFHDVKLTNPTQDMSYPGIERATLLIALDNGGINRNRSEEQQKAELAEFLEGRDDDLPAIDAWLASLTDEQLEVACCGEETEMEAMMADAPAGADQFLNDYFDEVC